MENRPENEYDNEDDLASNDANIIHKVFDEQKYFPFFIVHMLHFKSSVT